MGIVVGLKGEGGNKEAKRKKNTAKMVREARVEIEEGKDETQAVETIVNE